MPFRISFAKTALLCHLTALVPHAKVADAIPVAKDQKSIKPVDGISGFPLVQFFKVGEDDAFFQLQVSYGGEEKQSSSSGIKLQVEISNPTEGTVAFRNFFHRLHIKMRGENNQTLELPPFKSREEKLFKNTVGPNDTPENLRLVVPFKLVSVAVNDKQLTAKELEAFVFTLQPKSKMRAEILIEKVVSRTYLPDEEKNLTEFPLPSGVFPVELLVTLSQPDLKRLSSYRSVRETNKKLTVDYKREPDIKSGTKPNGN